LDLTDVACGRLDGYWERGLKPWDITAGIVIVEEAGGKVTAYDGSPLDLHSGRILATNGLVHDSLSEALNKTPPLTEWKS
jgi:myo-inositol-1(or 4)-monophosphatase